MRYAADMPKCQGMLDPEIEFHDVEVPPWYAGIPTPQPRCRDDLTELSNALAGGVTARVVQDSHLSFGILMQCSPSLYISLSLSLILLRCSSKAIFTNYMNEAPCLEFLATSKLPTRWPSLCVAEQRCRNQHVLPA